MRPETIPRLQALMRERGYDAVVAVSPENFAYLSGFVVPSQPLMRWRHAACVVGADGRCAIMVVDMEESTVRARAAGAEVRSWGEFRDRPMSVLARLLADLGLSSARIGTEFDYLPAGAFAELQRNLPQAELCAAEEALARLRQIKTPEETAHMRALARIADRAIHDSLSSVAAGSSEMDIAAGLTRGIFELGAESFKLMIVATGERSVYPNVGPTARKLREGDVCRVEIFAMGGGYHAGVCRTAYVQRMPPQAERIWQNLVECKYLVMDMIRPGASSRAIYEAFIAHLGKLKLPPINFVGHGIGLHLHEKPYLDASSDVPLEAGMVLGIEPLVYNTGYGFGMQNKDIVAVTEAGCELLSDYTNTDRLFPIN
jgi:Xaa-Pro dipeptidase